MCRASACTTVSRSVCVGCSSATVSGRAAASVGSTSTAVTWATSGSSARVSEPRPGPTSTTTSSGPRPASRTILRTVLASTTKFWPHCLVGRRPRRAASSRTRAAPRSSGEPFIPGASGCAAGGARSGLAGPRLEAEVRVQPVRDGDLLLAGGQARQRREVVAVPAQPRLLEELQAAVVAGAQVEVPPLAGLAPGDLVPHRGVGEVEAGAGRVAGGRRRRRGRRSGSGSGSGGLGADGDDLVDRVLGDRGARLVARLELAVDPHLVEGHALLAGDALGGGLLGPLGQGGVVLVGHAERDRLGLGDRLLLDPVDRDGQALGERGLGRRVD